MAVIKNMMVRVGADFSGLVSQTKTGSKAATTWATKTNQAFRSVTASSAGLKTATSHVTAFRTALSALGVYSLKFYAITKAFEFLKKGVTGASDLVEVQNVVDTAFGDLAYKAEEFANNANAAYGLTALQAKKYSSNYMAMAKSMGLTGEAAADMSVNLTALAGDAASFFNTDQEEAYEKLRSIFTGTIKPLRDFGVSMTQADLENYALSKGLDVTINTMTQAEKAALRYSYVMDALSYVQGDFTKTSKTWANQTRQLTNNLSSLGSIIGGGLIAVFKPFLIGLNQVLQHVISFGNAVRSVFSEVFGTDEKVLSGGFDLSDLTSDMDDLTESETAATTAASALKRQLMGFDEITKLNDVTAAGGGASGASDLYNLSSSLYETDEDGESIFTTSLKKFHAWLNGLNFEPLSASWNKLKGSIGGVVDLCNGGLNWAFEHVLGPLGKWFIEDAAPASLDILSESIEYVTSIIHRLQPYAVWLWDNFLSPLAAARGDTLSKGLEGLADTLGRVNDAIQNITDVMEGRKSFGEMLKEWFTKDNVTAALEDSLNIIGAISIPVGLNFNADDFKSALADFSSAAELTVQHTVTNDNGLSISSDFTTGIANSMRGAFEDFFTWLKSKLANTSLGKLLGITVDETGSGVTGKGTITAGVKLERSGPQVFSEFKNGWNATGANVGVTAGLSNTAAGLANQFEADWTKVSPTVTVNNKLSSSGSSLSSSLVKNFGTPLVYIQPAVTKKLTVKDFMDTAKTIQLNWTPQNGANGLSQALSMGSVSFAARGGIVDRATLFGSVVAGEAGREAIIPLENHTEWMDGVAERIAARMAGAVPAGGGEYNINVTVDLDGRVVGQTTVKYIQDEARAGHDPLGAYI